MDTNQGYGIAAVLADERRSKVWGAKGATVGQMRALNLPQAARNVTPVTDGGVTSYTWTETECKHEDCTTSDAMANACKPGQKSRHFAVCFLGPKCDPCTCDGRTT